VNITDAGSAGYCIQLRQENLGLQSGKTYAFSFDAKASKARSVIGYVGQAGSPYTNYLMGSNADWSVQVGTASETFSKTFTASTSDPSARIDINLGGAGTGTVTIDNVKLSSGRQLPQYALTTVVAGKPTNRIVRVPDQAKYDSGTSVALFAMPDSGIVFTAWAGDASGTRDAAVVVVDAPKQVAGNFGNTSARRERERAYGMRRSGDRIMVDAGSDNVELSVWSPEGAFLRTLHRGPRIGGLSIAVPTDLPRGIHVVRLRGESGGTSLAILSGVR